MSISEFRNELDLIDQKIQNLLLKRFEITRQIGKYKQDNQKPLYDFIREQEIISKILQKYDDSIFKNEIVSIQSKIMDESKNIQSKYMKGNHGLIGKNIEYSYSPIIHSQIAEIYGNRNYHYDLFDVPESFITQIVKSKSGVNVTVPYKESMSSILTNEINPVNTIVNENNLITGYNTDLLGLEFLIKEAKISINDNVAIFANSATTKSIVKILNQNSIQCTIYSRSKSPNIKLYTEFNSAKHDVIINTLPQKFNLPEEKTILAKILENQKTRLYIDINYFPGISQFAQLLKRNRIKVMNGLSMLIVQAHESYKLFHKINKTKVDNETIVENFRKSKQIIIGPPSVGKTTYGKKLARKIEFDFIDLDELIVTKHKMSVEKIIESYSLDYFRKVEIETLKMCLALNQKLVIATGGGIVESDIEQYIENWHVIYIEAQSNYFSDYDYKNRPLFSNIDQLKAMMKRRTPIYKRLANVKLKQKFCK
jgi:shikimate 5-dehydrogenase/shikimate kinase